jgi:hypothetical protein
MLQKLVMLMCVVAVSGVTLRAQAKPAAKRAQATTQAEVKPEPAAPRPAPAETALPVNIRIDVSITDQTGNNPPAKKLVSIIAGDRQSTNIRSSASVTVKNISGSFNLRNVTINVDARPAILLKEPTKLLLTFGLEYMPKAGATTEEIEPGMATLSERLGLVLESGKPLVISQAADPTSDRKITVEVTATILK